MSLNQILQTHSWLIPGSLAPNQWPSTLPPASRKTLCIQRRLICLERGFKERQMQGKKKLILDRFHLQLWLLKLLSRSSPPSPSLLIPSFLTRSARPGREGSRPVSKRDAVSHRLCLPTLPGSSKAVGFIRSTSLSACLSREPAEWEFLANTAHWQMWPDG